MVPPRETDRKRVSQFLSQTHIDISGEVIRSLHPDLQEIVIENITPQVEGGRFPVKCLVGDKVSVEADILKEGSAVLGATLQFRKKGSKEWAEVPMLPIQNERWRGEFIAKENSRYFFRVEAWLDPVLTWVKGMEKRCMEPPVQQGDLDDGLLYLTEISKKESEQNRKALLHYIKELQLTACDPVDILRVLSDNSFLDLVKKHPLRTQKALSASFEVMADRRRALYGTWYEMFPRSQGTRPGKSGTFLDCIRRLPDLKRMGFNVISLPPIHPIGITNRKGPDGETAKNPLKVAGSPWAIGSAEGGHKSVHPELGTIEDFVQFLQAAKDFGIEIALDYTLQCSPDHPYVKEHPDWFFYYPDGSLRYAEDAPIKYTDVIPFNFYCDSKQALWEELKSIVLFWVDKGVRIFRVDSPHTKPLGFWQWLIDQVQTQYPDVLFLSKAFTRPKILNFLAKSGFTQSYTYFPWKNTKWEIQSYLEELIYGESKHYLRGNFFTNTADLLPNALQKGGIPAFKQRAVLAATLSATYGIYSGYELCENEAKPGTEEYLNSEKFQIKTRDWNNPGHIKDFIWRLNFVRSQHPALQDNRGLFFCHSHNENILVYGKKTADLSDIILVVVNLDPLNVQEDHISIPLHDLGVQDWQTYKVKDLVSGEKYYWRGSTNFVRLDPKAEPAHIFELKK